MMVGLIGTVLLMMSGLGMILLVDEKNKRELDSTSNL